MVKIVKQVLEVEDTFRQCSNVLASFIFVELFDFLASEDLPTPPLSIKSSKGTF
jgi:hypothetical protein